MTNISRLSRKGGDYGGGDQSNMINLFSQGMMYYLRVSEEEYDFNSDAVKWSKYYKGIFKRKLIAI